MTDIRNAIQKRAAKVAFSITRDDIMSQRNNALSRWSIETDTGASAKIIAATKNADGKLEGFAEYHNTGLMLRFVQTGGVSYSTWKVRCAVYTAEDTGDQAGTLSFSEKVSGGVFNRDLINEV